MGIVALFGLNTVLAGGVEVVIRESIWTALTNRPIHRVMHVTAGRGSQNSDQDVLIVDVLQIQHFQIYHIITINRSWILPPFQPVWHHHVRHGPRVLDAKVDGIHCSDSFHGPDAGLTVAAEHNGPALACPTPAPLKLGFKDGIFRVHRPMHPPLRECRRCFNWVRSKV